MYIFRGQCCRGCDLLTVSSEGTSLVTRGFLLPILPAIPITLIAPNAPQCFHNSQWSHYLLPVIPPTKEACENEYNLQLPIQSNKVNRFSKFFV